MIDLAISVEINAKGKAIVETNHGLTFEAQNWPQDSDFQLVAFNSTEAVCQVVRAGDIAEDISEALKALERASIVSEPKPDWFLRLSRCSASSGVR